MAVTCIAGIAVIIPAVALAIAEDIAVMVILSRVSSVKAELAVCNVLTLILLLTEEP